ncbi:hypothetical protein ACHAWX_000365 [Stephanocyclus meneghinianus]
MSATESHRDMGQSNDRCGVSIIAEDSMNDGSEEDEAEGDKQNNESDSREDCATPPNEKVDETSLRLGGSDCTDGKPAYAVLTGIWTNNDDDSGSNEVESVTIPITNLPVVLGRKWGSKDKDPHHVALPWDEKLLSRLHACIFYRDEKGGKLGSYEVASGESGSCVVSEKMIYKPFELDDEDDEDSSDPDNILRLPGMNQNAPLPKDGFYAIECLGRHTIRVGDKKVTKGKQAMLEDGIPIQIASYCFYFLLPKDAPSISQTFKYPIKKGQASPLKTTASTSNTVDKKEQKNKSKEDNETKLPQTTKDSPKKDKEEESISDPKEPPAKKSRKSEETFTFTSKLDNVSTAELIEQLAASADSKEWTREDQLVSATLGIRIVRSAAQDSNIQKIAREQHGVTQRDIIDWYNEHPLFSYFERLMLLKIEYKSYQSSITKAIQRAGFTRNESNPGKSRSTRWDLPPDIPLEPVSSHRSHGKSPRKGDDPETSKDENRDNNLNDEPIEEMDEKVAGTKEGDSGSNTQDDTDDVPLSMLEKSDTPTCA